MVETFTKLTLGDFGLLELVLRKLTPQSTLYSTRIWLYTDVFLRRRDNKCNISHQCIKYLTVSFFRHHFNPIKQLITFIYIYIYKFLCLFSPNNAIDLIQFFLCINWIFLTCVCFLHLLTGGVRIMLNLYLYIN